jgi:hypothetical protein
MKIMIKKFKMYENLNQIDMLVWCIMERDIDTIEDILRKGANVNFVRVDRSMLMIACIPQLERKDIDFNTIKCLIDNGADWNLTNDTDEDFFDYLYKYKRSDIVEKIKKEYPNLYEDYLTKKETDKYNL